jgi:ABC-type lipoprotein export system ATPase subunit
MLLELKNISKQYETPSGENRLTVLRDVSLSVGQRETLAIVGPSGSGKSTLLNIIGALDRPTSGTVMFDGRYLAELNDSDLASIRNLEIGFVFQLHHLLPQCTVLENILVPTIPAGRSARDRAVLDRAKALLARVGLESHTRHFPAQLSGGELQRVAVVRALINRPKLVLADEPTGSLDRDSAENLGRLLVELNTEEDLTLIVVTHSAFLGNLMNRTFLLKNGVLESGAAG